MWGVKMNKKEMDKIMDEWWGKNHKEDSRWSGDFTWYEINEFGIFLYKKIKRGKD